MLMEFFVWQDFQRNGRIHRETEPLGKHFLHGLQDRAGVLRFEDRQTPAGRAGRPFVWKKCRLFSAPAKRTARLLHAGPAKKEFLFLNVFQRRKCRIFTDAKRHAARRTRKFLSNALRRAKIRVSEDGIPSSAAFAADGAVGDLRFR